MTDTKKVIPVGAKPRVEKHTSAKKNIGTKEEKIEQVVESPEEKLLREDYEEKVHAAEVAKGVYMSYGQETIPTILSIENLRVEDGNRRLQVYSSVAMLLNFTKAAKVLNMSQPAVTFQIQKLEETLKTRLFDRTNNRVELTQSGYDLVERVQDMNDGTDRRKGMEALQKLAKDIVLFDENFQPTEEAIKLFSEK